MPKSRLSGNLLEKLVPILLFASIGLAFMVGVLWQKVDDLEGGPTSAGTAAGNQVADGDNQPQQPPKLGKLDAEQAKKLPPVTEADHIRGSSNPKVYLVEYSDYECPYCQSFHATAKQVVEEYDGQVAWVYRHFPLTQIHPQATPAALAAECVNELGGGDAFWAFSDAIFANQQTTLNNLASTATGVGINEAAFNTCLDSAKHQGIVDNDYQGGISAGVTGTPGNFIVSQNGDTWFIPGAYPYEQIKPIIDEALQG